MKDEAKKPDLIKRWAKFLVVLNVLLIALKLCDAIAMPWLWVFAPTFLVVAVWVAMLVLLVVGLTIFSFLNLP